MLTTARSGTVLLVVFVTISVVYAQVATLLTTVSVTLGSGDTPRDVAASDDYVFAMTYHTGSTTTNVYTLDRAGSSVVAGPLTVSTSSADQGARVVPVRNGSIVCMGFSGMTVRCYNVSPASGALTLAGTGTITSGTTLGYGAYSGGGRTITCAGSSGEYIYLPASVADTVVYFEVFEDGTLSSQSLLNLATIGSTCTSSYQAFATQGLNVHTLRASPDRTRVVAIWSNVNTQTWLMSFVVDPSNGGVLSCAQNNAAFSNNVNARSSPFDYLMLYLTDDSIYVSGSVDIYDLYEFFARFDYNTVNQALVSNPAGYGSDSQRPITVTASHDLQHVYAVGAGGVIQQYAPTLATSFHSNGYGEAGAMTVRAPAFVSSPLDDYVYLLGTASSQAKLFTTPRDALTLTPTLVAPATGDVLGDVDEPSLNVSYVLPEAAGANTVELRFQPHPSGSPFTIGLVGTTSATFTLPFTAAAQEAHANVRGTGTTIVNGHYNVTVRYNDSLGNVQASSAVQSICLGNEAMCVGCPPGSYHVDEETCELCDAGTYSSETGATGCTTCDPGQGSDEGATECEDCTAGQVSTDGLCEDCVAGRFSEEAGASTCVECDAGTFAEAGATECEPCDDGFVAPLEGATECEACASGEVSNEGRTACETVAIEGGGGTLLAAEEVGSPLIIVAAVAGASAGGIVGAAIWAAYWAAAA